MLNSIKKKKYLWLFNLKHWIGNKYFFIFSFIFLFFSIFVSLYFFCLKTPTFSGRFEKSIEEMYDEDDLSACCLFAGNFINFGYWDNSIDLSSRLTVDQRINSEKNLYRLVLNNLSLNEKDSVLEVACGQGVGAVLALSEYNIKEMIGIDLSKAQIRRAKTKNSNILNDNIDKLFFIQGNAQNIPFYQNTFNKIFSIEAAQHFENLDDFTHEVFRVLKPGGKIAIATFFTSSEKSYKTLSKMIQTVKDGIDNPVPINNFEEILRKNGFINIKIESIGDHVWRGFDQWTAQGELCNSWTRNWYKGYKKKLIDYYLITADKPDDL